MNNTSNQLAPLSSSSKIGIEHSQSSEMSPLTAILSLLVLIAIPAFLYALFLAINCPAGIPSLGRLVRSSGGVGGGAGGGSTDELSIIKVRKGQLELVSSVRYCKETNGEEYGSECPVCLSGFVEGDHVRQLNSCKHSFHVACIDKWLLYSHSNCPLCRASVSVKPTVIPKRPTSSSSFTTTEEDFRQGLPDSASLV